MQNLELILSTTKRVLSVREFVVDEALDTPFRARLIVRAGPLSLEEHIGEPATFRASTNLAGSLADVSSWTGQVIGIEDIGGAPEGHRYYRVELAAKLWLLSQNRTYRVFERVSEVAVVCKILDEWGIKHAMHVDPASLRERKFIVQYGESDLDFIHRNLESAGVAYTIREIDREETLVLSDEPQTARPKEKIPYLESPPRTGSGAYVTHVRVERRLRPAQYLLQDLDYRKSANGSLKASASSEQATPLERLLARFHYCPGFSRIRAQGGDTPVADDRGAVRSEARFGGSVVERRLEAKTGDRLFIVFDTNVFHVKPGMVVSIRHHGLDELEHPILVTSTQLAGTDTSEWRMECTASPARVAYRPKLRTPRPRAFGVESATVVGPAGSEVHTDEFGRVRVQFHWDRAGRFDEESSCWIPVSQPWAGAGYGAVYLPRVGQEVFVEFLGGDPDLPVIVGRVYTALERVPYELPKEASVTVIAKTRSFGGSGGYNEIKADDRAGAELLSLRAERDMETLVQHVEHHTVGVDRITKVGRHEVQEVGGVETRSFTSAQPNAPRTVHTNTNAHHSLEVGASSVVVKPDAVTVTSAKIVLTTGGGASITLDGNIITLDATLINIKGSATVDIQGQPINLNCK